MHQFSGSTCGNDSLGTLTAPSWLPGRHGQQVVQGSYGTLLRQAVRDPGSSELRNQKQESERESISTILPNISYNQAVLSRVYWAPRLAAPFPKHGSSSLVFTRNEETS
ncbi:uncharacterized protein LOC144379577 [Halichoerus grypus]